MTVLLRTYGRLVLQLAVALGTVLVPASPSPYPSRMPAPQKLAQSSPLPARVSASHNSRVEPLAPWRGSVAVATVAMPTDLSASVGVGLDDSVAIPEPSVILLLLGGAGIAVVARRPKRTR